jgi:hypothetical protein
MACQSTIFNRMQFYPQAGRENTDINNINNIIYNNYKYIFDDINKRFNLSIEKSNIEKWTSDFKTYINKL